MDIAHTTQKNDAKEVTHYDIKVDGVVVGKATKGEKGKFNFEGAGDLGKLEAVATMRDLKVAVGKIKGLKEYVTKHPPEAKPEKLAKEPKPTKKTEEKPAQTEDASDEIDEANAEGEAGKTPAEDIDLD